MDERYYTVETLAELWECSTDLIYDQLRAGTLAGFKLGREWRISEQARRDYEEGRAAKPRQPKRERGRAAMRIV